MDNLKEMLFYGGIDAESYKKILNTIKDENKKSLRMYSALCSFVFMVCFLASFTSELLYYNRMLYLSVFSVTMVIHIILMFVKKDWTIFLEDLFVCEMYGFGICLSVINPNIPTLSYIILLFVIPLVFTDVPVRIIGGMIISIIVYIISASFVMTKDMFKFNVYNMLIYSFISVVVSTYLSRVKIERMALIYRNKRLISYDQMTELYNRGSYDKDIQRLTEKKEYLKIISMDVNGLKRENDTYGHAAGDDMIIAAANCFRKVIEPYGKCYRTGGDEFTAIIEKETSQDFHQLLQKEAETYILKTGTKLSISVGEADNNDSNKLRDIIHLADKRMYEEKKKYYILICDAR